MQSRIESDRRINLIMTDRPDSSKLVDLHIYIIPKHIWKNRQNLAENLVIDQAISAGFVRVPENLTIHDLRRYITDLCADDYDFPRDFIYLRGVGRCLTKVKQQQEKELKVKNYRPPTTFASEIYILEQNRDDDSSASGRKNNGLYRESSMSSQSWTKSVDGPSPLSFKNNNTTLYSVKISPRNLLKLREEQERLYYRQMDLARKRHVYEIQRQKQEEAAIKIQIAFRNYRERQILKQQEADAIEIERLHKEAQQLTRRKTELEHAEERQAHDVVKFSRRLDELRIKRLELEANRDTVVRRMKQLQKQINSRRKEERDLWRQKYFIEKNQIASSSEEQNTTNIHDQLEQAKIRLNNTTKLRQQAECESRLLRQELQQISSTLNSLERYRLPKQSETHTTESIAFDNTL